MKVLLTFAGFHDPYAVGLVGQKEQAGLIVSFIRAISFDKEEAKWLTQQKLAGQIRLAFYS